MPNEEKQVSPEPQEVSPEPQEVPVIVDSSEDLEEMTSSIFRRPVKGKYKIEFAVPPDRSTWKEFGGAIKVWLSGSAMSGNADESVYFCPWCHAPILPAQMGTYDRSAEGWPRKPYYGALCTRCKRISTGERLIDVFIAVRPLDNWVDTIERYYILLEKDVDLYLKHFKKWMGEAMEARMKDPRKVLGQDMMMFNMVDKEIGIYTLARLTQDLSGGRELRSAIKAFLTA